MLGLGILYMLAELTQIDAMMSLVNGRDISLERDNISPKHSIFTLIEDNEIARNESKHKTTTDKIENIEGLRNENVLDKVNNYERKEIANNTISNDRKREEFANDKIGKKRSMKKNKKEQNLSEESNLNKNLIIEKNHNYKQRNNFLIQHVINNKTNASQGKKQPDKVSIYSNKDVKTQKLQNKIISNLYTDKSGGKESNVFHNIKEKKNIEGSLNIEKLIHNIKANDKNQKNEVVTVKNNILETKENVKNKEVKDNINLNPNNTNTIKQKYDETKKQTADITEASKVIQNKVNDIKNKNSRYVSEIKNIQNESTKAEKNELIESFSKKINIKESTEKDKVINKPNSNVSKISQIINNTINQTDINNKTKIEVNHENLNISEKNIKSDISTDINKQILESIQNSISRQGIDKQITVQLNPPELGKVIIRFQEQDSQITGHLEVSKPQTRFEVEQALPQIIRNLNDNGIQIRKLEVVSTDINQSHQESQESFKEQLFSGNDTGQGHSANNDMGRRGSDNAGFYDWLSNKSYMSDSGLENIYVGNKSINMLV